MPLRYRFHEVLLKMLLLGAKLYS